MSLSPQLSISYYPTPFTYRNLTPETLRNLINNCNRTAKYGVPFARLMETHEEVQTQVKELTSKIKHFINHPNAVHPLSIQKALQPIQLNDADVVKTLKIFNNEIFDSTFNIKEQITDACFHYRFAIFQNIMASIAMPSLFQFAFLLNLESEGKVALITDPESKTAPSQKPNENLESPSNSTAKTQTNKIRALFDLWLTSDKGMRKRIEDISKRIKEFQAKAPYHPQTLAEIWRTLEKIPLNGSDIANDLNKTEQDVDSVTPFHSEDRGKLLRLIQNIQGIIQYLFSYQTACQFYSKAVNEEFNETAAFPERLDKEPNDQNRFKKSEVLSWCFYAMSAIVGLTFGYILSKIMQRTPQEENPDPSLKNEAHDSLSMCKLDI